jgi:hypothetical protein
MLKVVLRCCALAAVVWDGSGVGNAGVGRLPAATA